MQTIKIRDNSIAEFLINQAKKSGRRIVIETEKQIIHIGSDLTPDELTDKFLSYSNAKIGLEGDKCR